MKPVSLSFLFSLTLISSGCSMLESSRPEISDIENVYLSMDDEEVQYLKESDNYDSDYTHCLMEDDKGTVHAWIRARGFSTRQSYKRSFTIMRTDRSGKERKFAFVACYDDESGIRNRLALSLYRDMGIPAPEVEPVALFLNGNYLGHYDRVPIYDGEELKLFYGAENLELYKCHFCEYQDNNAFGDEHPLQSQTEKKFPDNDDCTMLNSMIITFLELDDDSWNQWITENFDVEATACYCAAHTLLKVSETELFNYYIAFIDGKYTLLPWDNDKCLYSDSRDNAYSRLQARLLIDGSPVRTRYEEILRNFTGDELLARVTAYMSDIDRAIYYDHNRRYDYQTFLAQETYLTDFLNNRITQIQNNL